MDCKKGQQQLPGYSKYISSLLMDGYNRRYSKIYTQEVGGYRVISDGTGLLMSQDPRTLFTMCNLRMKVGIIFLFPIMNAIPS